MSTDSLQFNSGRYPDIRDSIKHSHGNIILLPHVSKRINYDNKFIAEEPTCLAKERKALLMKDLYSYDVTTRNMYNPEMISETLYGSPDYWYIIMLVNGFAYPTQVKPPSIMVPTKSALRAYLSAVVKNKDKYTESRLHPVNIAQRFATPLGV